MTKEKIAQVNDFVIYKKNLEDMIQMYKYQTGKKEITEKEQKHLMEKIIDNYLLLEETKLRNIQINENLLDQQVNELIKKFKSEEDFNKSLDKNNMKLGDLKEEMRKTMLVQLITDQEIKTHLKLTVDMLEGYYQDKIDTMLAPKMVKARHILVSLDKNPSEEAARKKAESLLKNIKDGEDFESVAKDYSDCPSADKGGDLGQFGKGQMVSEFERVAFELKENEVSDLVKTQFGYHIIKAEGKTEERQLEYKEAKPYIEKILYQLEGQKIMQKLLTQLRKEAKVEIF